MYELRVAGVIGPAARDALSRLSTEPMESTTTLVGPMDRVALHEVLDHLRDSGLELIGIRRYLIPNPPDRAAPSPSHLPSTTQEHDLLPSRRRCRVSVQTTPLTVAQVGAIVVPVAEGGPAPTTLGLDRSVLLASGFSGARGQTVVLPSTDVVSVAVGVGQARTVDATSVRDIAADVARAVPHHGSLGFCLPTTELGITTRQFTQAVTEGVLLTRGQSSVGTEAEPAVRALAFTAPEHQVAAAAEGARCGSAVARAVDIGRDVANGPAASSTTERMAEIARVLAGETGLGYDVFDRQQLVAMGCGGIVGPNPGAGHEPRLIRLRYRPGSSTGHLALVGEGLAGASGGIFDAGEEPHSERTGVMTGAAVVLGAMTALSELRCPTSVTAYLCCPDATSGSAAKPGDILTLRNGTTVEVLDTGAEGRLAVADGLALATEEPVDAVVDIASLTSRCRHTFGVEVAEMLGNDPYLLDQLRRASTVCDEPVWELPLFRPYRRQLDSEVADIATLAGGDAGPITAALFLDAFVGTRAWAHIDITGAAQRLTARTWHNQGATGFGAMLLIELAMSFVPPPRDV